jgi:formylglycine-generating enzyme required for sulfatase activity
MPTGTTTHGPTNASAAPGKWIEVKARSFTMSRGTDACRGVNEKEHEVELTRDFEMTATEVLQSEWLAVMGANVSHFTDCGMNCPADSIHWHMAAAYTNALSERTGASPCYVCSGEKGKNVRCGEAVTPINTCLGYRLPTEAEWELAYRADATTTLYAGPLGVCSGLDANLSAIAWYRMNADTHSHPSKSKAPNAWGFYDMSGNLWEWMADGFTSDLGSAKVTDPVGAPTQTRSVRGGSYNCEANEVRGGHRSSLPPEVAGLNVGFRPARTL